MVRDWHVTKRLCYVSDTKLDEEMFVSFSQILMVCGMGVDESSGSDYARVVVDEEEKEETVTRK